METCSPAALVQAGASTTPGAGTVAKGDGTGLLALGYIATGTASTSKFVRSDQSASNHLLVSGATLLDEGGQASVGATPHALGLADGTTGSPVNSAQPTFVAQRTDATPSSSIAFQFTYTKTAGDGFHYPMHTFVRQQSPTTSDVVAVTGSIYSDPANMPITLGATPSASGGSLATGTYTYFVSAIVGGVETIGSAHVTAAVTGPTGSVALNWADLAGATDYRVYRYVATTPSVSPAYQAVGSATSAFTDTGAAGTAGPGHSSTHWGLWGRTESLSPSTRLCGIELDVINSSGIDAGPRVDRVGSKIGVQVVAAGTADSSVGIDVTGDSSVRFHVGILFRALAFRDYGISFIDSDATIPAIAFANNQKIVGRNAAGTADVEIAKLGTDNFVKLAASAVTVDGTNGRLGVVTGTPAQRLHVLTSENASTIGLVENTNTGTGAIAIHQAKSDGATVAIQAHGSGRTTTRFGVTIASYSEVLGSVGNGLLMGTSTATPMIIGTTSLARMILQADGNLNVLDPTTIPTGAPSAGFLIYSDSGKAKVFELGGAARFIVQAENSTKTAGVPVSDGSVNLTINGTTYKFMTTA